MGSNGGDGYSIGEKAVPVENILLDLFKTFRLADDGRGGSEVKVMRANDTSTMFVDFSHVMLRRVHPDRVQEVSDGRRYTDIRNRRDDSQQFTADELAEIQLMRNTPDFFNKLVDSFAPTIFGHQDIKRAIILMLMGGVHKFTRKGINFRGDIDVCIVGDPSCAKSQFLKYAAALAPRSVYTSGKSSSAAGLAATVVKEPETGEFCIEAGALMLADNGICCIDEFDKIDVRDQAAIHEAMEQQTISITNDGIKATMNARTSILAAANTTGGRYDKTKPLKYSVALPPAILSRFDLVYVMIDEPDNQTDDHISPTFTTAQVKRYISYAKTLKPKMTSEAIELLAKLFGSLRRGDTAPGSRVAYCLTMRHLEVLIRLSEALARCHLDIQVQPCYVHLAVRFLKTSIIHVESSKIDLSEFQEEYNNDGNNENGGNDSGHAEADLNGSAAQPASENKGDEAGTGNKQEKKLVISYEYFQWVTRALVVGLRQHEDTLAHGGTEFSGMRQRDLIQWYVGKQYEKNNYTSMDEAATEVPKVKAIIESLIRMEGYLIVVDDGRKDMEDGENGSKPTSSNDRILASGA